jgi:hypothetical protein
MFSSLSVTHLSHPKKLYLAEKHVDLFPQEDGATDDSSKFHLTLHSGSFICRRIIRESGSLLPKYEERVRSSNLWIACSNFGRAFFPLLSISSKAELLLSNAYR